LPPLSLLAVCCGFAAIVYRCCRFAASSPNCAAAAVVDCL
jgi:hypothetical protein